MCVADNARSSAAKEIRDESSRLLSDTPMIVSSLKSPIPIPRKLIKNADQMNASKGINSPRPQINRCGMRKKASSPRYTLGIFLY